jgi:hypothetical protein
VEALVRSKVNAMTCNSLEAVRVESACAAAAKLSVSIPGLKVPIACIAEHAGSGTKTTSAGRAATAAIDRAFGQVVATR